MTFEDNQVGILLKAIHFAAAKHIRQRRKSSGDIPYINHPIEVAFTLFEIGGIRDPAILTSAILHDTIEDTNTTAEEISTVFGQDICAIVLEVSDDKRLPKAERKRLQILNAPHKSISARLVKLADKICNIRDILHAPPPDWSTERQEEYLDWTAQVVNGLRGINPALENEYDTLLAEGRLKFSH